MGFVGFLVWVFCLFPFGFGFFLVVKKMKICSRSEETKEAGQEGKRTVRIIEGEVWIVTSFSTGHSRTRSQQAFSFLLQLLLLHIAGI